MAQRTRATERRLRDHSPAESRLFAASLRIGRDDRTKLEGALQELAKLFLRRASGHVSAQPHHFLPDLAYVTLGVCTTSSTRRSPTQPHVSVFNPTVDVEGWEAPLTVVRANVSERPFVVDTIRELLHSRGPRDRAHGLSVRLMWSATADWSTSCARWAHRETMDAREALVHCEVERIDDSVSLAALDPIRTELTGCLRGRREGHGRLSVG